MIALLDYGAGNTRSVGWALDRLGADWTLTADPAVLDRADKLLLPGVGAAGTAMQALCARGLAAYLRATTKPTLGICLGLQLLYEQTDEDAADGLGLLPGTVRRLPDGEAPTPHMGWNTLNARTGGMLLPPDANGRHAFFAHSFAAPVGEETRATCRYAGVTFSAVVESGHLFATQFHPEKSGAFGASVLRRFLQL